MLITVPREQKDAVLAKLDQFIFGEDVQLGDVTGSFFVIAVVGPDASGIVSGIVGCPVSEIDALALHANRRGTFEDGAAIVTRVTDTGAAGYDVYVEQAHAGALERALADAGVLAADLETAETIRIEAGVPKFHHDMDEQTIPLEAGIEPRAISLTKGCYVGQEVIIRVLHRGHGRVARKLAGLVFDDAVRPAPGEHVTAGSREIGHITSSAMSPALRRPIALAYLHRDFLAAGTVVSVAGHTAVVTALPFVRQPSQSPGSTGGVFSVNQ